jgi:tripartite ATP-independent transporter DctP family solute receptor
MLGKKALVVLCLVVFACVVPALAAGAAESKFPTMLLQMGHTNASTVDDFKQKIGTLFAEKVSAATDGAITIEVLGDSQLGTERDMMEGLKLRTIDLAVLANQTVSNFHPQHMLLELPFILKNRVAARKFLEGKIVAEINAQCENDIGAVFLASGELGFRHILNSKQPIRSLSDLSGLKLRTPETPIVLSIFRNLGANPTPMAISEAYTGIQQKTIDGVEFPIGTLFSGRYQEICKYLSLTKHTFTACHIAVGKPFWDSLSPELQAIFQKAATEAAAEQLDWIGVTESGLLDQIKAAGMVVNEDDIKTSEFQEAVKPVYDEFRGAIGEDLFKRAMEELDKINASS